MKEMIEGTATGLLMIETEEALSEMVMIGAEALATVMIEDLMAEIDHMAVMVVIHLIAIDAIGKMVIMRHLDSTAEIEMTEEMVIDLLMTWTEEAHSEIGMIGAEASVTVMIIEDLSAEEIETLLQMAEKVERDARNLHQSLMAMILSCQLQIGIKLQLSGSPDRKYRRLMMINNIQ